MGERNNSYLALQWAPKRNRTIKRSKTTWKEHQKEKATNTDGQVGTWSEQRHKITNSVLSAWRSYATFGAEKFTT